MTSSLVIIFDELSKFVFRFALRCAGIEIGGGGSSGLVVENPEAQRGAG